VQRPPLTFWHFVIYSLRIRRVEYRIAEIPILLIPVFLSITDIAVFGTWPFWEGVLIFFFLFTFGDLVNCLADRDLDAVYKPQLTEAVYGLGIKNVIAQAAFSGLAAVLLSIDLSWRTGRWFLLPGTLLGLLTAYAYSVPPLRLKGRGLWQLGFYWIGLFAAPMLFSAFVVSASPPWETYIVSLAYGLLQTGVLLVNTAEDYPEDERENVRTVIIALGLHRGLRGAVWLASAGAASLLAAFATTYWNRQVPRAGWFALVPLGAAAALVVISLGKLSRHIRAMNLPDAIAQVKKSGKWVPAWITAVALSSLLASIVAFIGRR